MERMYDLYWTDKTGKPTQKVGGDKWVPMTHKEATTAKAKFTNSADIMLVEVSRTVQYHRNPTQAEIRFGHGATHYRDFKFSECYHPKTGLPKKRLKAKDDGLWYTYG